MIANRALADPEGLADLAVRPSSGHIREDLKLSGGDRPCSSADLPLFRGRVRGILTIVRRLSDAARSSHGQLRVGTPDGSSIRVTTTLPLRTGGAPEKSPRTGASWQNRGQFSIAVHNLSSRYRLIRAETSDRSPPRDRSGCLRSRRRRCAAPSLA